MSKKLLVFGTIFMLVSISFVNIVICKDKISSRTWYVDDDFDESTPGWGVDHFDKIQDAIDEANDVDTIAVYPGDYHEDIVVNEKNNLCLKGLGEADKVIINGTGARSVITLGKDSKNINLYNFTITNSGEEDQGLKVSSEGFNIHSCVFKNNYVGISIAQNAIKGKITNCTIFNSINGVDCKGIEINFSNCDIYNNSGYGYYGYSTISRDEYNTLYRCKFYNNSGGLYINYQDYFRIINCSFFLNYLGVKIFSGSNNNILFCNIYKNNDTGLSIYNSQENTIKNCTIHNNSNIGLEIYGYSDNNIVTNCTFLNNSMNIKIMSEDEYFNQYDPPWFAILYKLIMVSYLFIPIIGPLIVVAMFLYSYPINNTIYNNDIVNLDNETNSYDSSFFNNWNYNGIGNYWGNYGGLDEFPEDGIIDFPFYIEGREILQHKDEYPLKYSIHTVDCREPSVSLLFPNGEEELVDNVNITWNALDYTTYTDNVPDYENLQINISYLNGTTWVPIATNISNSGVYSWNTSEVEDGINYRIRIDATDQHGNVGSDISYKAFIINNNNLSCISRVKIRDITTGSTNCVKDGDDVEIIADIIGDIDATCFPCADLSCLGCESNVKAHHFNGKSASWSISNICCSQSEGMMNIPVWLNDKEGNELKNYGCIIVDNIAPEVAIYKPEPGFTYLNNKIFPIREKDSLFYFVVGDLSVKITAYDNTSGIDKIIYYLNGEIINQNDGNIFQWDYNDLESLRNDIKVRVIDNAGNQNSQDIVVFKLL